MFFSIVIPTYNRAHLIINTLDSIFNQKFYDFEVIIVDDGSTDSTKDAVIDYIHKHQLLNCYYYYKENAERGAARNFGIEKAKGQWITFLDSDDLFYPNHLQLASDFINNNSECKLFHSAYEYKNEFNVLLRKVKYPKNGNLNKAILNSNLLSCFGVFVNSNLFIDLKFDENRHLSGSEDWLLWLRLSARFQIHFQPQVSGCMVQHSERSVLNFNKDELLIRTSLLVKKLKQDKKFSDKNGGKVIRNIEAHMLTYSALHLVLSNQKTMSKHLFMKGIKMNPLELFSKRTLAFMKYLFLN
jgi:glycosyltransferase involved in cell wall biosynthesis